MKKTSKALIIVAILNKISRFSKIIKISPQKKINLFGTFFNVFIFLKKEKTTKNINNTKN